MAQSWSSWCRQLGLMSAIGIAGALTKSPAEIVSSSGNCALAQIKPDATLGSERSAVTGSVLIKGLPSDRIEGGARRGANLFHSFEEFNIEAGRGAYFTNPAGIENILSRVTGSSPSEIQGTLGVLGNANLFLINPNGIIFGPNASLDVNGSFVATTANAIQFDDQGFFSASAPDAPPVLTVNPSAFFFNQVAAQSITNQSVSGLQVPDSRSLLLVGGDVNLDGGKLDAPSGRVELGGVSGSGTVGLDANSNNLGLNFPNDVARADMSIADGAYIDVTAENSGSIAINAQNLEISGGSTLFAGIASPLGAAIDNSQAGDIEINATGLITLTDGSFITSDVESGAKGNAGDIDIRAGSLSVTKGAALSTSTFGEGDAGNLRIATSRSIQMDNQAALTAKSELGEGGNIALKTDGIMLVSRNSLISTEIRDIGIIEPENGLISTQTRNSGIGGNVAISADLVALLEGSDIASSNIQITAQYIFFSSINDYLFTLPEKEAVDVSRLVIQDCQAGGGAAGRAVGKLVVSGRGGSPTNPYEPLGSHDILADVQSPTQWRSNPVGAANTSISPKTARDQTVEAQGWVRGSGGEIVLTAQAPALTSYSPGLASGSCRGGR